MRKFIQDLGLDPNNFTPYKMLVALTVFFLPIAYTVTGVLALIGLDFITGILAARKNGIKLTSNRASRTIYKTLVYVLLLITGLIADRLVEQNLFVTFITYFLCIVEVYSIGENFQRITGLSFINYLKSYLEGKMKGTIDPKELADEVAKRKN